MDLGIIIAIIGSTIAIVAIFITMMLWVRNETNSLRKDAKEDRKDLLQICRNMDQDMKSIIRAIELEMKDFHYRLLEIERSRK